MVPKGLIKLVVNTALTQQREGENISAADSVFINIPNDVCSGELGLSEKVQSRILDKVK